MYAQARNSLLQTTNYQGNHNYLTMTQLFDT